jgi:5'-3' exonuclease
MSEFDDNSSFSTGKHLNIDTDSIVFAQCCIFNEDTNADKERIVRGVARKVQELTLDAKADDYTCFLTTSTNFRNDLVDDYKLNRDAKKVPRPVNLSFGKRWTATKLRSVFRNKLEADDLLGIHSKKDTIIWSIDKDLRQIPGEHLDDSTRQVITITEDGLLRDLGKKCYFDGMIGFYYQCLTGDSTDYIVGCGQRLPGVYASGPRKGEDYIKRKGIGSKLAIKLLTKAYLMGGIQEARACVISEYKKLHGKDWQKNLETQANLLWMTRESKGSLIKRWTYDDREEWFDLDKGIIQV